MKKNVKKNVLLSLSLLSMGALAVGGMALQNSGFVTANAENAFSESVEMFNDAKVRIQVEENDLTGIRFGAKLTNYSAEHNYTYGMLVIPTDYLTTYADEITAASKDYVSAFSTANVEVADMTCLVNTGDFDEDGTTENYIQGSLVTLKYANLKRGFTGIAYIKDADDNYLYSDARLSRSVSYIASVALHDYASDTESAGYQTCLKYVHGGVNLKNGVDAETGYTTSSDFAISAELTDGKISVTQTPAMGYAVKYATENEDIVTVDAEGNVTLVGIGTAEITVKCIDRTETVSVTVTETDMLKMSALKAQTLTNIEDGEFTYDESTGTLFADMKGTQDYRPILWKNDTTASGNFTASTMMQATSYKSSTGYTVASNTMNGITLAFMGDDGLVKVLSFAGKWVGGNGSLKLVIGGTAGAAEETIDRTHNYIETGELLKVINAEGELSKEYSLRFSQGLRMNVIRVGDTLTVNWVNKSTSTKRNVFKATYQNNVLTTQYYNSSNVWTDITCSEAVQSVLKDLLANANETVMMGLTARSYVDGVNGMTYSNISLVENSETPAQILTAKLTELGANTLTNLPTGFTYADNKLTTTLTVTEDVYPIVWTDEAAVEGNFTASVDMAATINSNTVNMNTKNGIALVFVGEDGSLKVLTFAGKWNTSGSAVNFDVSAVAGATSTTINAVQTDTEKNRTEISSISTDNLYNLRFNAVSMKVVRADNTLTVSLIDKNDTERGVFKATYASGALATQYYSSSNEWTDVSCATDIQTVLTELLTNESETVMMGLTARACSGNRDYPNGMSYSNIALTQN